MNWEATKLVARREEEAAALGGLGAYRLAALQDLKLKTVIKESHGAAVSALAFNHASPGCSNLFATVGGNQATIYDDAHMGDHVGIVVHFENKPSEHAEGGDLAVAAWLAADRWPETTHPHGDACLAVAGTDPAISIISVVEAAVVCLLKGHKKEVVDLAAAGPEAPNLLASLSRDGNVRVWDAAAGRCLASLSVEGGASLALAPDGTALVVGTTRGRIYTFNVPLPSLGGEGGEGGGGEGSRAEVAAGAHSEAVDCLRYLPGGRLATKSCDGRIFVWDAASGEQLAAWKVPGCSPLGGAATRGAFSTTADGRYLAVGNGSGDVYVYDTESGKREASASAIKVSAPVRAAALSDDCRHLLAAVGNGFLFRFEYLRAAGGEDGGEAENQDGNAAGVALAAAAAAGEPMDT